jgi:hypothetical protein
MSGQLHALEPLVASEQEAGLLGERFLSLPEIEPLYLGSPALSQVAISSTLSQLHISTNKYNSFE